MRKLITALLACLLCLAAGADHYVDDSGTVRKSQRIYVDDSGTVREIQRIYVDDSGTVRLVFQNIVVTVPDLNCSHINPGAASATFRLQSDGLRDCTPSNNVQYVTPTTSTGQLEVLATLNSGSCDTGTYGSWLALTSDRVWSTSSSTSHEICNFTIQIRIASTGQVLDTATITVEADGTP